MEIPKIKTGFKALGAAAALGGDREMSAATTALVAGIGKKIFGSLFKKKEETLERKFEKVLDERRSLFERVSEKDSSESSILGKTKLVIKKMKDHLSKFLTAALAALKTIFTIVKTALISIAKAMLSLVKWIGKKILKGLLKSIMKLCKTGGFRKMKTRIKVFGRTLKRFVKKPAALLIGGIALGMAGYFSAIFKKEKEEIDEIGGEEDTPVISETPLEKSPEVSKPVEEKNPPAEKAKGTPTKTETAQAPISGQVRTESGGGLVTSEGAPVMTGEQEQKPSSTSTPAPPKAGTPTKEPSKKPEEKIAAPISAGDDKSTMDMIKTHEGVRTKPYKDSVGLWTIGVGHLIGDGKTLPPEWNREFTMSEIDKLFMQDYEHHKKAAEKIPAFDKLNKMGQAALIDLTFNMGPAWYKKWPTLMKQLLAGDFQGAADNLKDSTWYKQVKNRGVTIVNLIRNAGEKNTEIVKSKSSSGSTLASAGPTEYDKNKETKVNVIVSSKTNIKTNNIEEPRKAA